MIALGHDWHHYQQSVYRFALILRAADLMPPNEDEYWERPEKWHLEWKAWQRHNHPCPPEDDVTTLSWERFVVAARRAQAGQPDEELV